MPDIIANGATNSRKIALFPGAFRPPHAGHFLAIEDLVSLPDIDEIIIIVANRARHIPGTTKALEADVAQMIWSVFLGDIDRARVEMAAGSAVQHAIEYFERARPGDELVFCLGETDLGDGDDRFKKIDRRAEQTGVRATIRAAPKRNVEVRATAVRAALARGEAGRKEFLAAMPEHLSDKEGEQVWRICRENLREISDIAGESVARTLRQAGYDNIETIGVVKPGKTDPVFRVTLDSGDRLYVKYANDTVKTATLEDPASLKPRGRLSVERRAIRWLRATQTNALELPEVVYFDKQSKLLAMSEVCRGGTTLQACLGEGRFDPIVAGLAAEFLARNHAATEKVPVFWGDDSADQRHWQSMLKRRFQMHQRDAASERVREQLAALHRASERACENRYMHLDFLPKNILTRGRTIGLIDLELSSSCGDPAYDFGYLIGAYLRHGIDNGSLHLCREAVTHAIHRYREQAGPDLWPSMSARVLAYAGAALLDHSLGEGGANSRSHLATASALLDLGTSDDAVDPAIEHLIFRL